MINTFKLIGEINNNIQGQIDISITLPQGLSKNIGRAKIVLN